MNDLNSFSVKETLICTSFLIYIVLSPCRGEVCANNERCVADFDSTPPKTSCNCKPGFLGPHCQTGLYIHKYIMNIDVSK